MMVMDVEGGFDNIVIDNLADFMTSRGCLRELTRWVWRWAWRRRLSLWFNGRQSRPYYTFRGVPQGSPLSPCLFGFYVADIFRCRLTYTPSRRQMVASYVDDGVILVAADTHRMATDLMVETWQDCSRVAEGSNMSFSLIKTKRIGFGDVRWEPLRIGGMDIVASGSLRVLGFFFNMYNNFSAHVDYRLDRGIGVRGRIGAFGRRYGGVGGIGAWEMIRLIRGVYLATVYYGLKFVMDCRPYIRQIQTHVNSTIQTLFRVPNRVATNILLAETGIPPVHVQGRYLQRRCYARAITYRYNADFPWFMDIQEAWADPDIQRVSIELERVLVSDILVDTPPDKGEAIDVHNIVFGIVEDAKDARIVYTDGSKNDNSTGTAWIKFHHGAFVSPVSTTLPRDWSITECELYAIWNALRSIDGGGRVCLFTDAVSVLQMIRGMKPVGESAGLWHALVSLLNRFDAVAFGWSPGHALIAENEMADVAAKEASNGPFVDCQDISFGIGNDSVVKRKCDKEWRDWCNDPTIGSYNYYHLSPNGISRGNQRWYGLVYFIQIAGKPRIRPRELLSSLEVLY